MKQSILTMVIALFKAIGFELVPNDKLKAIGYYSFSFCGFDLFKLTIIPVHWKNNNGFVITHYDIINKLIDKAS